MKFGIMAPYQLGPVEDGDYAAEFGRLAEELGFESIWAVDHVVMCPDYTSTYPYDPSGRTPFHEDVVQPDPLIWLGWVAASTQRIKLATGILILPLRNPVVLAKTVASLDRLSGGRVLLGVGVGWVREEAEAAGTDFASRGRRCDEAIEAMRALWCEPISSYEGDHFRFEKVVSRPKPLSSQGVPIIVGGHSRAAARRAGRLGDGIYPLGLTGSKLDDLLALMRASAEESGRDPAAIEVTCMTNLDPAVANTYLKQGVDRLLISAPTGDLGEMRKVLETFRRDVMEPLGG
ncbi:MAG: LLM class F420-dependent oxidoreductase [Deltaproteobacteria bacterium]|nr:LLM class F420-dependent oxidoreductase [Deltaproteobacteria bacterium]MBW2382478.1 LLM class F420-dependent oxidoreductase [Deltaproteobacteria bacterium]MBW2694958.1 LLM class F420-dependent oxidoreductase [Deltaproteobacteria bacterium]